MNGKTREQGTERTTAINESEARLRECARQGMREGFPHASEEWVERQVEWFLGEDPCAPGETRELHAWIEQVRATFPSAMPAAEKVHPARQERRTR